MTLAQAGGGPLEKDAFIRAPSVAVLSDTHVGSGDCVLDDDGGDGYAALRAFLHANRVQVDTFILLGDIFDLSLATYEQTVASARRLFATVSEFCRRIIYVPGNHDHHEWQLVNEQAEIVARFPDMPARIPRVERRYTSSFLSHMGISVPIEVCYPNLYWEPPAQAEGVYVFHHGHFCQPTYRAISELYRAAFGVEISGLQALETINSGWLELVWYALGQASGGMGANGVLEELNHELEGAKRRTIEDALQRLYERRGRAMVSGIRESIREDSVMFGWLAAVAAKWIDRHAPEMIERLIGKYLQKNRAGASKLRGEPLSGELKRWCWEYLRYVTASRPDLQERPVSFVFGHTHRPGVWPADEPHLFNDGAWARAANDDWPMPAVLVIDERGRLMMLEYGPEGRTLDRREYPFSPVLRPPAAAHTAASRAPRVY